MFKLKQSSQKLWSIKEHKDPDEEYNEIYEYRDQFKLSIWILDAYLQWKEVDGRISRITGEYDTLVEHYVSRKPLMTNANMKANS